MYIFVTPSKDIVKCAFIIVAGAIECQRWCQVVHLTHDLYSNCSEAMIGLKSPLIEISPFKMASIHWHQILLFGMIRSANEI